MSRPPAVDDGLVMRTLQLQLVAARASHLRTELDHPAQLAALLNAEVPSSWPPGEYDRSAIRFFLSHYEDEGPDAVGWYAWYAIRPATADADPRLVGAAGYFGPPTTNGVVEIGYSVIPEARGRGYGTELARALAERALSLDSVRCVVAHVADENVSSRIVLQRAGFSCLDITESGKRRYERKKVV